MIALCHHKLRNDSHMESSYKTHIIQAIGLLR